MGLVMGAGGTFGWAFHLGVLDGLRLATGLEIHDASRVISTSAGTAISAARLSGRSRDEILALAVTPPTDEMMVEVRTAKAQLGKPWRWLRPQSPRMAARQLLHAPMVAAVGLMPEGPFPTASLRRFVPDDAPWPSSLWITAVDLATGETVVLGRDAEASLQDAIEASGTVPPLMQPKEIGSLRLVDGAVTSATHGDLLDPNGFDMVVVSSPMTRPGRGPVKLRARRHLRTEFAALRAAGARVVIIEPTAEIVALGNGFPRSNPQAGHAVADAAKDLTLRAFG